MEDRVIKDCPFCGACEPEILVDWGSYGYTLNKFAIRCANCGARFDLYDNFNLTKTEATIKLIKMWNSRINENE